MPLPQVSVLQVLLALSTLALAACGGSNGSSQNSNSAGSDAPGTGTVACTSPQPAAETTTLACPAGTSGVWSRTRTWSSATAPTCWSAGEWTPTEPPPGTCVADGNTSAPQAGVAQGAVEVKICTSALEGTTQTYNIRSDADFEATPWSTLTAGTVVNLFNTGAPYRYKIGLSAMGTAAAPVVINGVTDADCNKPVLDFADATTAPLTDGVFNAEVPQYNEGLGGIVIKRVPGNYDGDKPAFITVQGLELRGAKTGANFTTLAGGTFSYADGAAIYIVAGADILLQNLTISDSDFGVFVMAKDGRLALAGERITLRTSRFTGNGRAGSYLDHNVYMQASNPLTELSYFGRLREGAEGSSYKDRSSNAVFRHNTVEASARTLDFVQSEDQEDGIAAQPDYGTDYVHGNTLISHGPEAIHYGGDNQGEQDEGEIFTPPAPVRYRHSLYFWNNQVTVTAAGWWRVKVFDLSLSTTTAHAWNNRFAISGAHVDGESTWLEWAGVLNLGPNTVEGATLTPARSDANPAAWQVNTGWPVPAWGN